jgi:DNA-binding MarR family transcriptional regulator
MEKKTAKKDSQKKVVKVGLSLDAVIFELVKLGIKTPEDIARRVGVSVEEVQKALDRLEKKGLILKK